MFHNFKSYFEHNKAERDGAVVLLIVIFLIFIGTEVFQYFYEPPSPGATALQSRLDSIQAQKFFNTDTHEEEPISLFPFNPNTLNDSGYQELGFSKAQIQTLRNYQKAGGHFDEKSDFQRLYFVDSAKYRELKAYIDLPIAIKRQKRYSKKNNWQDYDKPHQNAVKWSDTASYQAYEYKDFSCDLNYADTTELKKVRGLGSFYARRIVEYRTELGGFHSLGQLLELWKMTPGRIDTIASQLTLSRISLKKLNINTATAQELSAHPYITFRLANQIVGKRESNGSFSSIDQFCKSNLVNAELCGKLAPYLKF
jgi:DNA uptake protein ComE-like DNA-binding protein